MFGLGLWEILAILVVIVVFIKPEDLPAFLRHVGRLVGRVRSFLRSIDRLSRQADEEIARQPAPRGSPAVGSRHEERGAAVSSPAQRPSPPVEGGQASGETQPEQPASEAAREQDRGGMP